MASLNYNVLTETDLPVNFWDKVNKTNTCWISENTKGHVHGKYKDICPNGHDLSGEDADVYFSMRKPRHGNIEVMHIICSLCNYPQVVKETAIIA